MTTSRLAPDLIETTLTGRVKEADVRDFLKEFILLGQAKYWLFDATATTSYEADAVKTASDGLSKLSPTLVVAVTNSLVRMGASVVALVSRREMVLVKTRAEALKEVQARRLR